MHRDPGTDNRAIEITSEPISDDNWQAMPDGVIHSVDEDHYLLDEPLAKYAARVLGGSVLSG